MKQCSKNSNHWYSKHLDSCPWCDIEERTGKDYFPSPIGFQVGLDDSVGSQDTLEKRKENLLHYIKIALVDGILTEEEKSYIYSVGEKLHLQKRDIENMILTEQRNLSKISVIPKTSQISGIPKILVKPLNFSFNSIQSGTSVHGEIEISNIGGGILTGSVLSNKKYLTTSSSTLDSTKHYQTINFTVDSTGLPYGMKDTVLINISSNGGYIQIPVKISIELPEIAFSRFISIALPSFYLICGLLGLLLGEISILLGIIGLVGRQVNRIIWGKRVKYLLSALGIAIGGFFFWFILWGITLLFDMKNINGFFCVFSGLLFASVFRYPVIEPLFTKVSSGNNKIMPTLVVLAVISAILLFFLNLEKLHYLIGITILIIIMVVLDLESL